MTGVRHALIIITELAAAGVVLAVAVVWPATPEPPHADAVVVLSGDGARVPGAVNRMQRGVAPTLVFAGQPDTEDGVVLCRDHQPFEVVCVVPSPDNTRTEAQATSRLGNERGWRTMVVVTSKFHVTRARLLFGRCFDGRVTAVGEYPRYGRRFAARGIVHEWLALVRSTLVLRRC